MESSIEKEGNEVEKIEDSISVSENTETKTPYNNEPKDGKSSEKKCKFEPQNINISHDALSFIIMWRNQRVFNILSVVKRCMDTMD